MSKAMLSTREKKVSREDSARNWASRRRLLDPITLRRLISLARFADLAVARLM